MRKPIVHLVCNAHIDPVWQWEWEEGACEALSTFRMAADLCEQFETFIFNHNEVILYKWVEQYESKLFNRIRRLVKAGRWHIMSGWYLQPDCNMPSAKGLVRQILAGGKYFQKKFSVRPTTAINFNPFGHIRGLIQILAKSGYDFYVHCRTLRQECGQQADDYIWIGYDGSEIICTCPRLFYNSPLGKAGDKLRTQLEEIPELGVSMMLWGVGNHGGRPSRKDIQDINRIIAHKKNWTVLHSTPEVYFKDLTQHKSELPSWKKDLNPWAVGCYTSMIRIKQGFRALGNVLFMTEKMSSTAAAQGLMPYSGAQLKNAEEDLLLIAFHDVLSGSSIPAVEQHALQKIVHGMELLSQIPTVLQNAEHIGDVAYGRDILPATDREVVAQKWTAVVSEDDDLALTIVNDGTYASSFKKGHMRITLLRCPAYVAHPVKDWAIVPDNMFRPRIDQGERLFSFWMNAKAVGERMSAVAREAQIHNEKPMAQWFSPSGSGVRPKPFALLSNRNVKITAIKQAENGKRWIIRLFEPTGRRQKTQLSILASKPIRKTVTFQPFEIKTLKIDAAFRSIVETNLIEETE